MAIPDFQSCMRPLLSVIADGEIHHFLDAFSSVCDFFNLNTDERGLRLPSGRQTIIKNRVGWSRTYLKKAGLLTQPERGYIQITELGLKALQECPDRVDVKYLNQFEAFKTFHTYTAKPDQASQLESNDAEENTDPTERLEQAFSELQNELASDLLDTMKQQSPLFLETVVVELMQAMGYGGWSQDSGKATQYSNDGGIDGIINEDPLGLDVIYLQAKRYNDATVGRPEIQS
ncbi:MAG: restriction endonuclease, partial [Nitrosomonas sp.]|nr:restriction endonuclease [Nitrosomonas sp.]